MIKLLKKIQAVKAEIGKMPKDKNNPFIDKNYFDINVILEHLEPLLQKYNLLLMQPIDGGVITSCIYDLESDEKDPESLCSSMNLPDISDPQKIGSAITYFRRYTLTSLLSLQAEDDDGNKASGRTKENRDPQGETQDPETRNGAEFDNSKQLDKWIKENDALWNRALEKEMPLKELRTYVKVSKENAEKYLQALTEKVQ